MVYIDFHCHLDYDKFDIDREELTKKLKSNNILSLTNTVSPKNYKETKELFKNQEHIKVCPGLYPQEAEKITDLEFNNYLKELEKNKDDFLVIGEVGLDHYNTTEEELQNIQEKRFRKIIELAIKIDKPLCIHTRKAEEKILNILEEYVNKFNFRKFNLHCFMGKKKLIPKIKELQIYCSIPLILLNTQSFQILVENLSVKQLLVETDSPFLNPDKTRNSPLNVIKIYDKIAEIKGLDKKEIEHIIYNNYQKLVYL